MRIHPTKQCNDCGGPICLTYPPKKRCRRCQDKFKTIPIEKRFFRKVKKTPTCWWWIGYRQPSGHGQMGTRNDKTEAVHRISYRIHRGEIPKGMDVLHNCPGGDNPSCVNPEHLWLGTQSDNDADKVRKNRQARGEDFPHSKLNKRKVEIIRNLYEKGIHQNAIAKRFNVDPSVISRICRKYAWAHVI